MIKMHESENFQRLKSSAIKLGCVLLIAYFVESYNGYFKDQSKIFSNIFYMLGGTYLTANLMSTPIVEFQKSLNPYLPRIFRNDQKLADCIHRFRRLRPFITKEDTIKKVEQYIKDAEIYSLSKDSYDAAILDAILSKINFILTLFEPVPKVHIDIQHAISQFDDLVIDNKEELISKILVPFILKINGESNIPINPVYLLGNPGVGKTYFVKKMSEILNIPIIQGSIIDYNYHQISHGTQKFDEKMIHMYLKALHTAITTKKTRTFIMFIDEFDKKLSRTSNVLEYMNCNNNEVHDDYIDITSDIGDILPVCAGNKKISKVHKVHMPLEDRFVTIIFPKMSQDIKRNIIYNVMNIPQSAGIDLLINADKFHGLRQLIMKINMYRSSVMGQEFFKGTNWEKLIKDQLAKESGEDEENSDTEQEIVPRIEAPPTATQPMTRRVRSKSPAKRR